MGSVAGKGGAWSKPSLSPEKSDLLASRLRSGALAAVLDRDRMLVVVVVVVDGECSGLVEVLLLRRRLN